MFYYISFLRPPPLETTLQQNDPILITPQICNDLRTEFLESDTPIDIYFSWSLQSPTPPSPVHTKPAKLTSWRTSTAYKEITVPRPPRQLLREGQAWRLVLACGMTRKEIVIGLGEENVGSIPFGVMSMPVTFTNRTQSRGQKQEKIVRSYYLPLGASNQVQDPERPPVITFDVIEHTSFDLDKKIWDSGIGLSFWLVQLFAGTIDSEKNVSNLRESLCSREAVNILELGAGTGIVAITLAILRSTLDLSESPGHIVTTDLPSAMPIIRSNITANSTLMSKCEPQPIVLDWEDETLPTEVQFEGGIDIIVMADVTYNTSSFPALIGTLSRLIEYSKSKRNGRPPMVLMGYKERHSDERSLWDRANEIDVRFRKVTQVDGAGGNPVEVWLG